MFLFNHAYADDWTCTDVASIKSENTVMACGVATADTEGEAREKALKRARTEFELICETSAECAGRQTIVEPLRNSCELLANGRYKCFRGLRYTVLSNGKRIPTTPPATQPPPEIQTSQPQQQTNQAQQSFDTFSPAKHIDIGFEAYNMTVVGKYTEFNEFLGSQEKEDKSSFSGQALFLQYALTDSFAIKASMYSMKEKNFEIYESSGTDVQLRWANDFVYNGWKFYLGLGAFSDTWTDTRDDESESFSGAIFSLGFGYNWNHIAFDVSAFSRASTAYNDIFDAYDEMTVTGSTASLAFRF